MTVRLLSELTDVEVIATGNSIRELPRLLKVYGSGRWRKLKGRAMVESPSGRPVLAEVHFYEAHGIGRKEFKIKRLLE